MAKRLKEENEKLRKENTLLQEKLAAVEQERDSLREVSRKRWRDETPQSSSDGLMNAPQPKRPRVSVDPFDSLSHTPTTSSPYTSSPSSLASSPSSFEHSSFSPIPSLPPSRDVPVFGQPNTLSSIFDFISSGKTHVFEPGGGLDTFNCGFCTDSSPCVCRELAMQSAAEERYPAHSLKVEHIESRPADLQVDLQQPLATPQSPPLPQAQRTSILDDLPAYQPPVLLRRRNCGKPATNSIFPVSNPSSTTEPTCTGDPSNCPACADDAFGKAFCSAISKSVTSNMPCSGCPSRSGSGGCCSSPGSRCCGNPAGCGRGRESLPSIATLTATAPQPSPAAPVPVAATDTISCDDAWRQIKSHPNVNFADLDLLADVVARRSKCTGPRAEIFPAPGSVTPERGISPPTVPPVATQAAPTSAPAGARFPGPDRDRGRLSPSLQLVPQEVLVQCGRQRIREVNADGVRDALRLLDLKFSLS